MATTTRNTRAFTLTSFKASSDELFKRAMEIETELVNVGCVPVFHKILTEEGGIEDLHKAFGKENGDLLFTLASCLKETGQLSYEFFDAWKTNRYLPFNSPLDIQKFSDAIQTVGISEEATRSFFALRATRNKAAPVLVYASSFQDRSLLPLPNQAYITDGEKTANRGLLTVIDSRNGMPILLKPFPGDIVDFRTFLGFLMSIKDFGIQKIGNVVFGPEFFSEMALLRSAQSHAKCIFVLPQSADLFKRSVATALEKFSLMGDFFGSKPTEINQTYTSTLPLQIPIHGHKINVWVHYVDNAYRRLIDNKALNQEIEQFEKLWNSHPDLRPELEIEPLMQYFSISTTTQEGAQVQKLEKNINRIAANNSLNGILAFVSTWDFSADEGLEELGIQTRIANMINMAIAKNLELVKPTRASEDGMLFLAFISFLIEETLRKRIREGGKSKAKSLRDWERLDSELTDPAKIVGALEGFSYLRRKSTKSLIPLPPNTKQKKAVELCGLSGILESIYNY